MKSKLIQVEHLVPGTQSILYQHTTVHLCELVD